MAQVRRQAHNPSTTSPRQKPPVPNSLYFPPSLSTRTNRQTQSFQQRYAGSPLRATHNALSPQTGAPYRSINNKYDLLTCFFFKIKSSFIISSPLNRVVPPPFSQTRPSYPPKLNNQVCEVN